MKKRKSTKSKKLQRKLHPRKKSNSKEKPQSFVEFLRSSPLFGSGIDLTRQVDPPDDEPPLFSDC